MMEIQSSLKRYCSRKCRSWDVRNPGVPHPAMAPRSCAQCGVDIAHRDVRSQYCSPTCRDRYTMGYVVDQRRSCARCGEEFLTRRKSSQYCTADCMRAAERENGRSYYLELSQRQRARKRAAVIEQFTNLEIFERDAWICYLCGLGVNRAATWPDPSMPSLDHVVPLILDGPHSRANTRCSHLGCNLRKGTRMLEGG